MLSLRSLAVIVCISGVSHGVAVPLPGLETPKTCNGSVMPRAEGELPTIVYRGDTRTPEEIQKAGGFSPLTHRPPEQFYPYDDPWSPINLVQFNRMRRQMDTVFVSTTTDLFVASHYTTKHIYKIDATPNIIDLDDTLKDYSGASPHWGALGGLLWTQVIGWYDITDNPHPEPGKPPNSPFFNNTHYDPRFAKFRASRGQQQLMEGADRILRDRYGGTDGLRKAVMEGQATPEEGHLPDAAFLKTRATDFMESLCWRNHFQELFGQQQRNVPACRQVGSGGFTEGPDIFEPLPEGEHDPIAG